MSYQYVPPDGLSNRHLNTGSTGFDGGMFGRSLFSNETFTDGFVLLGIKSVKHKRIQSM